jgi:hypothetical protein
MKLVIEGIEYETKQNNRLIWNGDIFNLLRNGKRIGFISQNRIGEWGYRLGKKPEGAWFFGDGSIGDTIYEAHKIHADVSELLRVA